MDYCSSAPGHPLHGPYHDREYGFPVHDDQRLFERLILEIQQAGLSWELVLRKREAFNAAFENFDIDRVARFDSNDVSRLLSDSSIIRNRRKVEATIENAKRVQSLQKDFGSFYNWIYEQHPKELIQWVKLFRSQFIFMGPEVVKEFLLSIGVLPGAHRPDCPVYSLILKENPLWQDG